MSLDILDFYPAAKQNDVHLDVVPWAQFNKQINWDPTYGPFYMVLTEMSTMDAVNGTVSISADLTTLHFTPLTTLKANTRYILYVFGGEAGVSAGSGTSKEYLVSQDNSWDFVTGTIIGTNPSPSGEVPVYVTVPSGYLEVVSTSPAHYSCNQDRAMQSIMIEFNHPPVLPSGTSWFDMINITRKNVI